MQQYRGEHNIRSTWQARERIVVGLTGGPEGRTLLRRAARLAEKGAGGEVLAVYIARSDGLTAASPKELAIQRTLVEDLGGSFHQVIGEDIPAGILEFARGVNATQIVLGVSRRKAWQYAFGPGVSAMVARESGPDLDVHLVTHDEVGTGTGLSRTPRTARLSGNRLIWGWLIGMVGPVLLAVLLRGVAPGLGLANDMLLFLTLTVAAALLGGMLPALASAAFGSLLLNYYFTPPVHHVLISNPRNIVALVIFIGVAVSVASVVDLAARRTHQAARLRAESEILSHLAGSVLRGENSLESLLETVRETFAMEAVALLERASDTAPWTCAGSVGTRPHAATRRAPSPRATASAPRCSPPSATTCAPRSPASRRRCPACAPTTSSGPRRTGPSSWRRSRRAPTGSTTSSATSWTCPASRPTPSSPWFARSTSTRSSRSPWRA